MIPGHLPKAWVTGILSCAVALVCMCLAIVCLLLDWRVGYAIFLLPAFACIAASMACVPWFFFEKMSGRVTRWKE